MAYLPDSPRKCRGECGKRKPASEFDGADGRVCWDCSKRKPSALFPLDDGRTAVELLGKHARGRVAYVSNAKVPRVAGLRWRVMEYTNRNGVKVGPYAVAKRPTGHRGGEMVYMHILVAGRKGIDHYGGDGLDNTDPNLRVIDQDDNCTNRGKQRTGGTSRFIGVDFERRGKWRARARVPSARSGPSRQATVGLYAEEEQAAKARDRKVLAVRWIDGRGRPVARLNFPDLLAVRARRVFYDGTEVMREVPGA